MVEMDVELPALHLFEDVDDPLGKNVQQVFQLGVEPMELAKPPPRRKPRPRRPSAGSPRLNSSLASASWLVRVVARSNGDLQRVIDDVVRDPAVITSTIWPGSNVPWPR